MTGLRWNGTAWLLAGAVLLTAILVLASLLLAPDPPQRMAIPTAGELLELASYLDPGPTDVSGGAEPSETITIDGDPFADAWVGAGWDGGAPSGWSGEGRGGGEAPGAGAVRGPRWTLSAVLIAGERRTAILNDQLVRPGDRLEDGTRVEVVERDHVVIVTPGGERRRLELERQEP